MRRIRIAVCLTFVISCLIFGVYIVKIRMVEDHTPPVITCEKDEISVSVKAKDKELLKGLKAKDNKDGDITKSIRVSSMSHFIEKGKRTVTYAVFDKANQVATKQRTLVYTDYESPRIYIAKPLRFTMKQLENANFMEYVTAKDCLDGDLTNQIYTTLGEGVYWDSPGEYSMTVQVSNSAGDVCAVPVEVTVTNDKSSEENDKNYPLLSGYIAYTSVGNEIDLSSYLIGVMSGNAEYTFEDANSGLSVNKGDIDIRSNVDYSKPGAYTVEYAYKNREGITAVTKLVVVVEE